MHDGAYFRWAVPGMEGLGDEQSGRTKMTCVSCGSLVQEHDRFCAACGTLLQPSKQIREARKRVSILFLDIVSSTTQAERLDPESWRQVIDRFFATCSAAVAEHGGMVEKFIGDAVLAVFGATLAHEDDAERAVRAAAGALAALPQLNKELMASHQVALAARCGICSGDVVVITPSGGDFRVVGDTVNTASRLQTAAGPGEILIDADTAAMVRPVADIEPVPPLRLKGKAHTVRAWRVVHPVRAAAGDPARMAAPLIGRADEMAELAHSLRRVTRRRQVCLVTVLGAPGIGKSRLVREFVGALPNDTATILSGRCSAYGKGMTYQPLADMLGSWPGGWAALRRDLAGESGTGGRAASSLASIVGDPIGPEHSPGLPISSSPEGAVGAGGAAGVEEIAWAVRYLLEVLGKSRPVILVWEDLQWAEPTLLNLIEDVTAWLIDVPALLLCTARSELLDARSSWGGGKPCSMTLELGPLTHEQSVALVAELASRGDVRAHDLDDFPDRVVTRCDGNPLFAELMLDVFAEVAPAADIPPTIQALLGARLDQLPAPERQVLEMAAVAGRDFSGDTLRTMAARQPEGPEVDHVIARLLRRRIIQRDCPGTFRFTQALLRDTVYAFTPKSCREKWHILLAEQLAAEERPDDTVPRGIASLEFAYHVEAAFLLRRELRPGDRTRPARAGQAASVLIAEGMNALNRKDLPAAATLLERGRDLLPAGDPQHTWLALRICDCTTGLWDEKRSLAALTAAEAALADSRRNAATCAIQRCILELRLNLAPPQEVAARARQLTANLAGDVADDLSWCRLLQLEAYLHLAAERAAAAGTSFQLALARAQALGDSYEQDRILCATCELAQWTPEPVSSGLDLCARLSSRFAANRALLSGLLVTRAYLTALSGRLGEARRTLETASSYACDLHLDLADAAVAEMSGFVESLAGAHATAEAYYRRALAALRASGRAPEATAIETAIARELFEQGHFGEAAAVLDRLSLGNEERPRDRVTITALRARIASVQGRHAEATTVARQAGELAHGTDDPCLAGMALFDLAIVLEAAGRREESAAAARQALARFDAKEASLLAARVRDWLPGTATHPGCGDAHA
jgi:class 3 adenylate cyclase/tetratricopeptide (TPR) repeat protein